MNGLSFTQEWTCEDSCSKGNINLTRPKFKRVWFQGGRGQALKRYLIHSRDFLRKSANTSRISFFEPKRAIRMYIQVKSCGIRRSEAWLLWDLNHLWLMIPYHNQWNETHRFCAVQSLQGWRQQPFQRLCSCHGILQLMESASA